MSSQSSETPGPSSSIDIPRHGNHESDVNYDSMHGLVGSPEHVSESMMNQSTPRQQPTFPLPTTSSPQQPVPTSRPSFTHRASSPYTPHRRTTISSSASNTSPSLFRLGRQDRKQEHEWSVFGSLMGADQDDARSHSSATIRSRRREIITPSASSVATPSPHSPVDTFPSSETLDATGYLSVPRHERDSLAATPEVSSAIYAVESDYDESDIEDEDITSAMPSSERGWALPTLTPLQRNVLKCSIAYFIGSLFTFSPYLSDFIADITNYGPGESTPSPSGHMVATVAVYFNPAKTVGGMLEADLFCIMGVLWAAFISLSSMSLFWFFEVQPGWEWLADSLVLLWIGAGMSCVAWMKLWMKKPTFNTACSMTAIMLFIVVVKEGGLETLLQVCFIVFVGSVVSNLVCYTLWPQHATRNLQDTMTKTLDSFSTLLQLMTQTFLLDEPLHQPSQMKIQKAVESHQASFTALKKSLIEAKSERWFGGPSKNSAVSDEIPGVSKDVRERHSSEQAYEDAIDSLNRLGQHLNGLRSGTSLQYELIQANKAGKLDLKDRLKKRPSLAGGLRASGSAGSAGLENGKGKDVGEVPHQGSASQSHKSLEEEMIFLQAAADLFGELVDDLGPPMKALSTTCSTTLKRLREAFVQPNNKRSKKGKEKAIGPTEFRDLADALERALFTFESTSNHAIMRLYTSGTGGADLDNPMLANDQSEKIFLVYFFIFALQEFAKELISLVDAMGRICNIQRAEAERRRWWKPFTQPIKWLRSKFRHRKSREYVGERKRPGLQKRISSYFMTTPAHRSVSFPKVRPHAPNTMQTPARENLGFLGRVKQSVWALGSRLRENDMRYAIKTGLALAMLAAPAFWESTRPIFSEYRGEWALISFFVVISPTIGATNNLGLHRVLGTLFGAATAVIIWTLFPENPYVLSIWGFFYSIPCFYYIVSKPQYAISARFVLLTYNLTCLYCYNLRQVDVSVIDVGFHRFVAVTVGVMWAAIVSRWWWPTEARRELSRALGEFCLNVGWLYTRLAAFNSFENEDIRYPPLRSQAGSHRRGPSTAEADGGNEDTEGTSLLAPLKNQYMNESILDFMAMELHLQIKLIELQGLLAQTQHEPRLKGPFPVKLYREILKSLQTILDKLHSMRCVTSREEWHTTVRTEFIIPVNRERREMVGNVILFFSVLASSFRLKSPLPPYLPPAEKSRQTLVEAIRKLDIMKHRSIKGSRQLLFFAYALTMQGVIHELDYLGKILQEAFGVIGGSREAFEGLFVYSGDQSGVEQGEVRYSHNAV